MLLILDANEYIFGLGIFKKESCESLINFLIDNFNTHSVCICRTIVEEVRANLTAAYTEWVGADVLVTENRHFLKHHPGLPFKVLTAENCLNLI